MSYALGGNPVPVWAAPERKSMKLKVEDLPPYMFEDGMEVNGRFLDRSAFLKHSGRWNSMKNYKQETDAATLAPANGEETDPTLLDVYDLNKKWENRMDTDSEKNGRLQTFHRLRQAFITNLGGSPYFPIFLRGSAAMYSIITLGLSCEVFVSTKSISSHTHLLDHQAVPNGPASSTIYTIVISCVSIVYSVFMMWDETFGQPLGLRPSHTKIKFVFIDLMLLCLQAGNAAAAFDMMIDRQWVCPSGYRERICSLHKAVIAFILITTIVHGLSFLLTAFRMIDRATH